VGDLTPVIGAVRGSAAAHPGRAGSAVLAAAADIGLDLLQSPPKAMLEYASRVSVGTDGMAGASGADGASETSERIKNENPMATPMKRGEMSPVTPGSRSKVQGTPGSTILRAGPGRLTLNGVRQNGSTARALAVSTRSKQAAPPPRFDQCDLKDIKETPMKTPAPTRNGVLEVTPKLTRSAKTRSQFGSLPGSHDSLAGGMIATLGSPTPLSTPEGFEGV
jgi:hypothetical protein